VNEVKMIAAVVADCNPFQGPIETLKTVSLRN